MTNDMTNDIDHQSWQSQQHMSQQISVDQQGPAGTAVLDKTLAISCLCLGLALETSAVIKCSFTIMLHN